MVASPPSVCSRTSTRDAVVTRGTTALRAKREVIPYSSVNGVVSNVWRSCTVAPPSEARKSVVPVSVRAIDSTGTRKRNSPGPSVSDENRAPSGRSLPSVLYVSLLRVQVAPTPTRNVPAAGVRASGPAPRASWAALVEALDATSAAAQSAVGNQVVSRRAVRIGLECTIKG